MPNLPPQHLKLAKQLRGRLATSPGGTRRFWAKVTAVSAGPPKTVTLQQGTLTPVPGIRYDDSYTPTVGDTVYGDAVGNDYLVVGSLDPAVSGGGGGASGALLAANNLSDLANVVTARTNLGASTVGAAVFTAASTSAARSAIGAGTSSLALGTTSTTALAGNTTAAGIGAATAAQGALADSATQPGDLGTAATVDTGTTSGTVPLLNASGRLDMARLASGTPDGTKFVRDDGTLATPSGGGGGSLTSQSKMLTSIVHFGSSSPTVLSDSFAVGTWHVTVVLSPMPNAGAPRQVIATASVSAGTATIVGVSTALVELTNVDAPMPLVLSFFLTVTATATVKITGYTSATDVTVGDNANTTGYTALKIA